MDSLDRLPELLRPLFWDQDFSALSWETNHDFIVRRVLQAGSWQSVSWLRSTLGDAALRAWIEIHAGGRLSPRQLRFWELVLDLPAGDVNLWIASVKMGPWERRVQR